MHIHHVTMYTALVDHVYCVSYVASFIALAYDHLISVDILRVDANVQVFQQLQHMRLRFTYLQLELRSLRKVAVMCVILGKY